MLKCSCNQPCFYTLPPFPLSPLERSPIINKFVQKISLHWNGNDGQGREKFAYEIYAGCYVFNVFPILLLIQSSLALSLFLNLSFSLPFFLSNASIQLHCVECVESVERSFNL